MGEKWQVKFSLTVRLPRHCMVLLHAAKLRHGTDGFNSPLKEGILTIFSPEKSEGSAGFEPVNLCENWTTRVTVWSSVASAILIRCFSSVSIDKGFLKRHYIFITLEHI
jgi:hypothetical protein